MSLEFFIAKRIYFNKAGGDRISSPAIRIAVISMALGLIVMILAVAIVVGFKKEVGNKVIGFGSHIQITNFKSNAIYENYPIEVNAELIQDIYSNQNVAHVQGFVTKPAIIKTEEDFQGIVIKGVDENFNWSFLKESLVEGDVIAVNPDSVSQNTIISKTIADKLNLKLNDSFICYFIQERVRVQKFIIKGIYQTNFPEYDNLFVIGDIKPLRKINEWDSDLVSGLEVIIKDDEKLDETANALYHNLSVKTDRLGNPYYTRSIKQINPYIFIWLDVLDTNVVVILIIIFMVAGFSMISGLLIIILERANMIGILKALGENNTSIRKIFLYISAFLITKGLLWGNIIALIIYYLQKYTGIFKLDPEIYYVSEVPMELNIWTILLLNIGTLIATILVLVGPSYLIAKISPSKTIRFE
ncbi:lipoprotein-releasing system permease protein [Dysgonomonadaceae bacterium PH5-43]|nr:lipoprotein-releasing system permease protein [Dysgonomonadaceae bacterium PH5-43]